MSQPASPDSPESYAVRPDPAPGGDALRGAISLGVEEPASPAALARWDETGGRVAV
jgi:hypothetical protein